MKNDARKSGEINQEKIKINLPWNENSKLALQEQWQIIRMKREK